MKRSPSLSTHARSALVVGAALVLAACTSNAPPKEPEHATDKGDHSDAVATSSATATEPPNEDRAPEFKAGPGGFPLPLDAKKDDEKSVGTIEVFVVERGKPAAIDELRALLAADGWKIESEEASPSNASLRFVVSKNGETFKASVTGTDAQAAFIVTPPKK